MASSPKYKIYSAGNEYMGCVKHLEDAARLMSDGCTIRYGHTKACILWTEGEESQSAGESFDHVAEVGTARENEYCEQFYPIP